jgi:hypothetical protein
MQNVVRCPSLVFHIFGHITVVPSAAFFRLEYSSVVFVVPTEAVGSERSAGIGCDLLLLFQFE